MLGWIASIGFRRLAAGGAHDGPRLAAVGRALEVDAPARPLGRLGAARAMSVPSASWTGLFLIGPRMPSGRRRASHHVCPPSRDVRTIPHHVSGSGRPCRRASAARPAAGTAPDSSTDAACRPAARRSRLRPAPSTVPSRCRETQMPTSRRPFARAAEPRRDEPGARLGDRRGMGAGERRGLEDELGPYLVGCAHDSDDEQHRCELPHLLDPFVGRRIRYAERRDVNTGPGRQRFRCHQ